MLSLTSENSFDLDSVGKSYLQANLADKTDIASQKESLLQHLLFSASCHLLDIQGCHYTVFSGC
jgi:hypothetical protein